MYNHDKRWFGGIKLFNYYKFGQLVTHFINLIVHSNTHLVQQKYKVVCDYAMDNLMIDLKMGK